MWHSVSMFCSFTVIDHLMKGNHKIGENRNNVPKHLHDTEIKWMKKKQKRRSKNKCNMRWDIMTDKEGGLS